MSQEFGATAWGGDWRRLAEPTALRRPNPALPKARSLARQDHVHDLHLAAGTVTAAVDDRGPRRVSIGLQPWTDAQHRDALARLAELGASDDLPDSAHRALCEAGLDPGPDPAAVTAECDCASRVRPCAHILAVFYETARRLDERPRLALTLRHAGAGQPDELTSRLPLSRIKAAGFYDRPRAVG